MKNGIAIKKKKLIDLLNNLNFNNSKTQSKKNQY